jgi:hypothetical protein
MFSPVTYPCKSLTSQDNPRPSRAPSWPELVAFGYGWFVAGTVSDTTTEVSFDLPSFPSQVAQRIAFQSPDPDRLIRDAGCELPQILIFVQEDEQ